MRTTAALTVLILVAAPAAALPLEFRMPGELQAEELSTTGAQWLLIIFDEGASGVAHVSTMGAAEIHNDTVTHAARLRFEENRATAPGRSDRTTTPISAPWSASAYFSANRSSSLLIV